MTPWFLYLIRTAYNKLYTGITTDVERRHKEHHSGKGANALRGKGELTPAFSAPVGCRMLPLAGGNTRKRRGKKAKKRGGGGGGGGGG
ncbi:GIY-YIG nuclease family protein, partial [Escherichia coli]|uniref:GIY-YIG nuclease family protein n=1 Tax=Escherichia coli TaxID=562 RepID=UPI0010CB7553